MTTKAVTLDWLFKLSNLPLPTTLNPYRLTVDGFKAVQDVLSAIHSQTKNIPIMNQYYYKRIDGLLVRCIIPLTTSKIKTALRNMVKYYHEFNPEFAPLQSSPSKSWGDYIRNRTEYKDTTVIHINWLDYKLTGTMTTDLDLWSVSKFDALND